MISGSAVISANGHITLLLGGVRSISVSGRFPWFVGRLLDPAGLTLPAFEMLCACTRSRPSDFVCVYGDQSPADAAAVDRLAFMFPIQRWPIAGVAEHNVIHELWKKGILRTFYRRLFSAGPLRPVALPGSPDGHEVVTADGAGFVRQRPPLPGRD